MPDWPARGGYGGKSLTSQASWQLAHYLEILAHYPSQLQCKCSRWLSLATACSIAMSASCNTAHSKLSQLSICETVAGGKKVSL